MKIWVVTEGSYSDYHIVGLFETEKEAIDFVGDSAGTAVEIEPWDTGVPSCGFYQKVWIVSIHLDTGEIIREYESHEQHPRDWSDNFYGPLIRNAVGRSVTSREHAFKLAIEARQRGLRKEE